MAKLELRTRSTNFLLDPSFDWEINVPWEKDGVADTVEADYFSGQMLRLTSNDSVKTWRHVKQKVEISPNLTNTDFYLIAWYKSASSRIDLTLSYYENNTLVESISFTTSAPVPDWTSNFIHRKTSSSIVNRFFYIVLNAEVKQNEFAYFDQISFQVGSEEIFNFLDYPVLPYKEQIEKFETRERGITGRMFSQFYAVKQAWEFNFYAIPREIVNKLREFFKKGYRFILIFEPSETIKDRAEVIWDSNNFEFEMMPGNKYWNGVVRLVEC